MQIHIELFAIEV